LGGISQRVSSGLQESRAEDQMGKSLLCGSMPWSAKSLLVFHRITDKTRRRCGWELRTRPRTPRGCMVQGQEDRVVGLRNIVGSESARSS
jgi:hypothetical protein